MSAADKNAATVRRGHAFNAGDLATLTEIFAEGAFWSWRHPALPR